MNCILKTIFDWDGQRDGIFLFFRRCRCIPNCSMDFQRSLQCSRITLPLIRSLLHLSWQQDHHEIHNQVLLRSGYIFYLLMKINPWFVWISVVCARANYWSWWVIFLRPLCCKWGWWTLLAKVAAKLHSICIELNIPIILRHYCRDCNPKRAASAQMMALE